MCAAQVVGGLPEDTPEAPEIPTVKGHDLQGGPQMIQLRCASLQTADSIVMAITSDWQ